MKKRKIKTEQRRCCSSSKSASFKSKKNCFTNCKRQVDRSIFYLKTLLFTCKRCPVKVIHSITFQLVIQKKIPTIVLAPREPENLTKRRLSSEHGDEVEQVPATCLTASPLSLSSRQRSARCTEHVFDSRLPARLGGFHSGELEVHIQAKHLETKAFKGSMQY